MDFPSKMKRKSLWCISFLVAVIVQFAFIPINLKTFSNKDRSFITPSWTRKNYRVTEKSTEQDFEDERSFYIFSIVAINSSSVPTWDSFIINGWESEHADSYTYKCCYLFPNGAISASKQVAKRKFISSTSPVNARQIVCAISNRLIKSFPVGVALVLHNQTCDHTVDFHKPVYTIRKPNPQFAIHGKVCYGKKNPAHLIEWLEYQRYFRVDKIIVHPYHLEEKAMEVLRYYQKLGLLEIVPFTNVPKLYEYPRMFGIPHRAMVHDEQVINYDAQERLRPYTYFSVIDTDEFIVPVNQSVASFVELMEILLTKYEHTSSFAMYDQLHLTHWGKTNTRSKLLITQYGNHSENLIDATKNLHVTARIKPGSVSIHQTSGQKGYHWRQANSSDVVLKHYRVCRRKWLRPSMEYNMSNRCLHGFKKIQDIFMERIAEKILPRVLEVRKFLKIK